MGFKSMSNMLGGFKHRYFPPIEDIGIQYIDLADSGVECVLQEVDK